MSEFSFCPICGGTGNALISAEQYSPCWHCSGSGLVVEENKEEEKDGD
ncbi:hypothetical protein [Escherichia phage phiWec179]|nr:hypothetical protein [Escherichia phage phiWec179]BDU12584.1 hypothetical protein [Escherichia phage phiWec181]BDU12729.1 hypothetical protein [Escherichia phage phiWec186]